MGDFSKPGHIYFVPNIVGKISVVILTGTQVDLQL